MKSSFVLILIILLFSCKKSKIEDENSGPINSEYNIKITGVVTDQVSGQPVSDALVSCGIQLGFWSKDGLVLAALSSTKTGTDGRYQLSGTGRSGKWPLSFSSDVNAVIASKSGFVGSNRQEIRCLDAHDCNLDIKLYHSCSLNLHIVNDTLNKIDKIRISFDKLNYIDSWTEPFINTLFILDCKKRIYDTTLIISDLWGNWGYAVKVLKPGGNSLSSQDLLNEFDITPKPDTLNYSDVSY